MKNNMHRVLYCLRDVKFNTAIMAFFIIIFTRSLLYSLSLTLLFWFRFLISTPHLPPSLPFNFIRKCPYTHASDRVSIVPQTIYWRQTVFFFFLWIYDLSFMKLQRDLKYHGQLTCKIDWKHFNPFQMALPKRIKNTVSNICVFFLNFFFLFLF